MVALVRVQGKGWKAFVTERQRDRMAKTMNPQESLDSLFGDQRKPVQAVPLGEIHRSEKREQGSWNAAKPDSGSHFTSDADFFTGDNWKGYAEHALEHPVRCAGCNAAVRKLYQRMDGNQIGDPRCRECSLRAMDPRSRGARRRKRSRKSA